MSSTKYHSRRPANRRDEDRIWEVPQGVIQIPGSIVSVRSVLYTREEGRPTCAVVLDIHSVFQAMRHLRYASLPFEVKAHSDGPDCYIDGHLPTAIKETVEIDRSVLHPGNIDDDLTFAGSKSGMGLVMSRTGGVPEEFVTLSASGQRVSNNRAVRCVIDNTAKTVLPMSFQVMLIVKTIEPMDSLYFPFSLRLASDFKFSSFGKSEGIVLGLKSRFGLVRKRLGPVHITGDFNIDVAKRALEDIPKFHPNGGIPNQVGLRAAMYTYAKPYRSCPSIPEHKEC